ncbi:hypothetical protein Taro_024054 [Colocasia esculenta]|uniref:Uncharacterized protein n=1 Tax=Colocasia esculenta TaxID=4460 RepID=A0A843V882_COLES|nr:hypothetical protein [Colocasia esculenta]
MTNITQHGGYIDVRDGVFVPPSDIYKMCGLYWRSQRGVCASVKHLQTCRAFNARGGVFVPPPAIYRQLVP